MTKESVVSLLAMNLIGAVDPFDLIIARAADGDDGIGRVQFLRWLKAGLDLFAGLSRLSVQFFE